MPFTEFLDQKKEQIFAQNCPGTYTKSRPSQFYKSILVLGIVNVGMAIFTFLTYYNLNTTSIMYSSDTQNTVFLPKGVSYIYIGLNGVHQNYLSYTKSINGKQLKGKTGNLNLTNTKPFDYLDGVPYYPAGAIAATYFQDEIILDDLEIITNGISKSSQRKHIGMTQYTPEMIAFPENWTSKTNMSSYPLNTVEGSGLPILDERFVNWINLATFSSFKKLWGKVDVENAGEYNLSILSSYQFASAKSVLISERSILGIPNYSAAMTLFTIGIVMIAGAVLLNKFGY